MCVIRHRQPPLDSIGAQAQRPQELQEGVLHVVAAGRNTFVDEQRVAFLAAGPVVADAAPGPDRGRHQAGAQRELDVQQHVEASAGQLGAQRAPAREPGLLVVDDEFDAVQAFEQPGLALADDPGDRQLRPGPLQRTHQGDGMDDVAQGGQAQEAERTRRGTHGHLVKLAWNGSDSRRRRDPTAFPRYPRSWGDCVRPGATAASRAGDARPRVLARIGVSGAGRRARRRLVRARRVR